ncbi:bifunctional [glutamine synthetase] adenylyltransferase/[glutamine synthetase]-adenylyl-L-tyrosine phosphorylase [Allosphingosinicella indica]|uniref:Glutamate-ammonia-ligase adenylyltransferase n=1 Tax=Allosphingosinicella indica TaxID=941907 RepID=A0A1X7G0X0_9SPHN|nr:bifunctional [glutamine synthetase] adenylyltransferase/[glutamine synthetase]-adenylyl-L-tyrosine phosphorylase [Allosphingosinicella indica]SMF61637.1 glutamate-ammonia-ligase adenylyltransferase [Allosphingosinicella indica]
MNDTLGDVNLNDALARARQHAPFLRQRLESDPALAHMLAAGRLADALVMAGNTGDDIDDVGIALRRQRSAVATVLAIGDLAGALPLEAVVEGLSDLADRALERAITAAMLARTPDEAPRGFAVIALGKHGSRELNYSSDIDVLFLYDPRTLPLKPREDHQQAALRIGQKVVEQLQARTSDGYVFRVDLRLRPSPEVTPIALPVDAAISYYESQALPWERAAFIRARFVAGDAAVGRYFLDAIHPFVWRRSLDFGAIGEIRSITGRIRDHYAQGQALGPRYDLKRGRGGIREIEFFAQAHQLIHGGREPALRAPATLDALAALAAGGRISEAQAAMLSEAYRLFRTVEHRLQMVDDRQTHSLPEGAALDNVARLHGLADGPALVDLLAPHVAKVAANYDALADDDDEQNARLPRDAAPLEEALARAGFSEAEAARQRVESWRSGRARSLQAGAAREAFEALLPALIEALGASPDPARALNRFDDIVEKLPGGVNFYRLLEARPALLQILATVLAHAPTLAEQLGRRPGLLDGLIDASAFDPPPEVDRLIAAFSRPERDGEDYQMVLDRVRRRVNERRFALGAQVVLARSEPIDVAHGYARVAEAALNVLADAAIAEFAAQHGRVPGGELLVLGLGRLGGAALTHASDLDLVYLFTGSHEAVSDGRRPLSATDYFNRLAPRVSSALSVPTAAGPLYEVDTRLRPHGGDGLLAVSLESFATYQRERAWTFEHMALTRARPVYGSADGRAALQAIVDAALCSPRDPAVLTADAARMRAEVARHKPPAGPFDIKMGEGGLVDLEFAIHTLQLREGIGIDPRLECAIPVLTDAGFVPAGIRDALRLLTAMLVTMRLVSPASAEPPEASRALVARACGVEDWDALLAAHDAARQSVSALWRSVAQTAGDE